MYMPQFLPSLLIKSFLGALVPFIWSRDWNNHMMKKAHSKRGLHGAVTETHCAHQTPRGSSAFSSLACLQVSSGPWIVSRSDVWASSTTPSLAMEILGPCVLEVSDGYMLEQDRQTGIRLYSSEK